MCELAVPLPGQRRSALRYGRDEHARRRRLLHNRDARRERRLPSVSMWFCSRPCGSARGEGSAAPPCTRWTADLDSTPWQLLAGRHCWQTPPASAGPPTTESSSCTATTAIRVLPSPLKVPKHW